MGACQEPSFELPVLSHPVRHGGQLSNQNLNQHVVRRLATPGVHRQLPIGYRPPSCLDMPQPTRFRLECVEVVAGKPTDGQAIIP